MSRKPSSSGSPTFATTPPAPAPDADAAAFFASLYAHERQTRAPKTARATGTGNLALTVGPSSPATRSLKLVFVRIHFSGGAGTATVNISVDSASGAAYDTLLATVAARGSSGSADCNYTVPSSDNQDPSPWLIKAGDAFLIAWTNPDPGNMTYGAEVGYVEY